MPLDGHNYSEEPDALLAATHDLQTLQSALYMALECDLSNQDEWPEGSKELLDKTFKDIDKLCNMAAPGTPGKVEL